MNTVDSDDDSDDDHSDDYGMDYDVHHHGDYRRACEFFAGPPRFLYLDSNQSPICFSWR